MSGMDMRELDSAELAELVRWMEPNFIYYGDPPEKWARNILLKEIRVRMARRRRAAA